jgi:hypothetical protein
MPSEEFLVAMRKSLEDIVAVIEEEHAGATEVVNGINGVLGR